jgi:F-type H+-transporting ATPase subunit b
MAEKSAKQPIASTEHIPASEHGKGFPPFNPDTFASQLVWLVLVFGALYLLMSRVALPRIGAIMDARRQSVEGDLAEAKNLKDSSDAAIAAYEKALAEARGRAQALANETHQKFAAEAEAARKELDTTLNGRLAEAEQAIAARKTAAMTNVQDIAIETAAAIVERLTGNAPAKSDVANAVAGTLKR